jgi:hypothetical protein
MSTTEAQRTDVDAIIRVKHLYGAVIDGILLGEYTPADLELVFAPDAMVELFSPSQSKGMEAIKEFFGKTIPSSVSSMWHSFSNPLIDVDGDEARGQWRVLAYTKRAGDPEPSLSAGRYAERYVRTPQGWRISELVFRRHS